MADQPRAEPTEQEGHGMTPEGRALQTLELMLRPGPGQCTNPNIAHAVLLSLMGPLDVEVYA